MKQFITKIQNFYKFFQSYWNYLIISNLFSPIFLIKNVEPYSTDVLTRSHYSKLDNIHTLKTTAEYWIYEMDYAWQEGGNYYSLDYLYYQELLKQCTLDIQKQIEYTNYLTNVKNIHIWQWRWNYIWEDGLFFVGHPRF